MAGYSARQSTYTTGDTIAAADTNDEFNQLLAAFNATTGHTHDGTAGDGGPISTLRDSSGFNKVVIDNSNNHLEFYVNVSSSAVEQVKIQDGAIVPVTDNDIDLGTSSLEFKDLYLDGTANIDTASIDSLSLASGASVTAINDEDNMSSDSATALATQQSIKAYVDSQVGSVDTLAEILANGNTTGGTNIDVDDNDRIRVGANPDLEIYHDTTSNQSRIFAAGGGDLRIAGTNVRLSGTAGTETMLHGTVNGAVDIYYDNSVKLSTTTSGINVTGTAEFDSLSDGTTTITGFVDEDNMSSDSASLIPTQQSVKAYVDSQVTAQDLDFQADTGGALSIDLDSESLTFTGGTGIDTSGSGNAVTFAIDSTVATLTGTQTLTNKTLTSAVLNTGVSGTAVLDEDNMASNSATQLATQQSIKAYVDSQVATANELSELTDTNITSPADGALLFYDTGTSKWIDNVVSGDITIADTGVAAIGTGVIVNADVNSSAAIAYSKLSLSNSIVNADISSSAAIADSKLATISTANKVGLAAVDIDGGTDIGADLTTSDLIVVDDGAGGTNRKAALSRVVTLMTNQGFTTDDPTALAIALG
jgi:hypothetical protein